jgi:hypothetical protein
MGDVTPLGMVTRFDIPADEILNKAMGNLESVVVIGYDHDGNGYFASSIADGGSVLWLMEKFKKRLIEIGEHE